MTIYFKNLPKKAIPTSTSSAMPQTMHATDDTPCPDRAVSFVTYKLHMLPTQNVHITSVAAPAWKFC